MYNDEYEGEEESTVGDAVVEPKRGTIMVTLDMDDYLGSGTLESVIADRISSGIIALLKDAVRKKVEAEIAAATTEHFDVLVRESLENYFARKVRKTDDVGEDIGVAEGLQEKFLKKFDTYISEKVSADKGTPINHYNDVGIPRLQYYLNQFAIAPLNAAIKAEVTKIADAAKSQIQASVSAYITQQLMPTMPAVPMLNGGKQ
jgi:hypothetical protein